MKEHTRTEKQEDNTSKLLISHAVMITESILRILNLNENPYLNDYLSNILFLLFLCITENDMVYNNLYISVL